MAVPIEKSPHSVHVLLRDPKDRKEFRRILKRWTREFRPDGTLETYLVDDITKLSWRLGITEEMEIKELLRRRESEDDDDLEYFKNAKKSRTLSTYSVGHDGSEALAP